MDIARRVDIVNVEGPEIIHAIWLVSAFLLASPETHISGLTDDIRLGAASGGGDAAANQLIEMLVSYHN